MDYQMVNINLYTRVEGNQAFPKNNFQAAPDVKKYLQENKLCPKTAENEEYILSVCIAY